MGGMTITEFLLARIAEDEAVAQAASASSPPDNRGQQIGASWDDGQGMVSGQRGTHGYVIDLWDNEGSETLSMHPDASAHVARHDPARVLAECAAKRAIIDSEFDYLGWDDWEYGCGHDGAEIKAGVCPNGRPECMMPIQQALAAVYADHPDYLRGWKL